MSDGNGQESLRAGSPLSVAYLLDSTELFGGVKVVLLQAEALARRGHRVTVVSPDAPPEWFPLMRARFERSAFSDSAALADAQVRVATFWETVAPALAGARGPVFHLCQGYEGEITFYRDRWGAIEEVYRAPTHKLAISATLAERLAELGIRPGRRRGPGVRPARDSFPARARPASDPPRGPRRGAARDRLQGRRDRPRGARDLAPQRRRFRLRRGLVLPVLGRGAASGDSPTNTTIACRRSACPSPTARPTSSSAPRASRRASGCPRSRRSRAGCRRCSRTFPGSARSAPMRRGTSADGDPESLARALPELLSEDARARAREAGPAAAERYDTARVARRLEEEFRARAPGGAAPCHRRAVTP